VLGILVGEPGELVVAVDVAFDEVDAIGVVDGNVDDRDGFCRSAGGVGCPSLAALSCAAGGFLGSRGLLLGAGGWLGGVPGMTFEIGGGSPDPGP